MPSVEVTAHRGLLSGPFQKYRSGLATGSIAGSRALETYGRRFRRGRETGAERSVATLLTIVK